MQWIGTFFELSWDKKIIVIISSVYKAEFSIFLAPTFVHWNVRPSLAAKVDVIALTSLPESIKTKPC